MAEQHLHCAQVGAMVEPMQPEKPERLARYLCRPPVSVDRLTLTAQGQVGYRLKTPYRDGTTDIVLEPSDFIAHLAALVPPLRVHLTRYAGVFAAHMALRGKLWCWRAASFRAGHPDRTGRQQCYRSARHRSCSTDDR